MAGRGALRAGRRRPGRRSRSAPIQASSHWLPSRPCWAARARASPHAYLRLESRVALRKRGAHALGPLPGSIARARRSGRRGNCACAARHARRGRGRRAAGPRFRGRHLERGAGACRERWRNPCSITRPCLCRRSSERALVLFDRQSGRSPRQRRRASACSRAAIGAQRGHAPGMAEQSPCEAWAEDCSLDAPFTFPTAGRPGQGAGPRFPPVEWAAEAMWQLAAAENVIRAQLDQEAGGALPSAELRQDQAAGASGQDPDALSRPFGAARAAPQASGARRMLGESAGLSSASDLGHSRASDSGSWA